MKKTDKTQLGTFLAGFVALLPLMLTVALIVWIVDMLQRFIGPGSIIGKMLSAIGFAFVTNEYVAYVLGILLLVLGIYALGILVRTRLKVAIQALLGRMLRPLPLVGNLYDAMERFVGVFTREKGADYSAMSPVWCFFGGEGGTAVLALMPNPEPVRLGNQWYHVILVPTAPVPIGGGLLYVPADWVKPAGFGVDAFTSVYVSMGISPTPDSSSRTEPVTPG